MRPTSTIQSRAFTLVEILIVTTMMAILAMLAVPRYSSASDDAREAQLGTDVQIMRRQIGMYVAQHSGRGPHLNEKGVTDRANMVVRLTGRTTPDGKIDSSGACGPYLNVWPTNSFAPVSVAKDIRVGSVSKPSRDDRSGWYYSTTSCIISPNTKRGAVNLDPEVK